MFKALGFVHFLLFFSAWFEAIIVVEPGMKLKWEGVRNPVCTECILHCDLNWGKGFVVGTLSVACACGLQYFDTARCSPVIRERLAAKTTPSRCT
jgi:hypothetical protein